MGSIKEIDDETLIKLLTDLESDRVERKREFSSSTKESVREAVCAFANDLAGHNAPGIIFIGAEDDGRPTEGFLPGDSLLLNLSDIKTDGNIVPPPTLFVEKRHLLGHDFVVVSVWPCDTPPVRFKGRIHVRWGPRRGLATAQDERLLNERRRSHDRPFDIQAMGTANLEELDRMRFEQEYLPSLVARDVLLANDRTFEQKLAATKMIVGENVPVATVLGILICGKDPARWIPGAFTQFLRVDGEDLSDPIVDEETITGTVADQIRRLEEKLLAHNHRRVNFARSDRENLVEDYPLEGLRQLVRNAFLHRTYESTHAPVRCYWFENRIEIHNPGGPFGIVTIENFGEPGITDYRNPNLAEALRALGFVQRFGAGITIARKQFGTRLRFEVQPGLVAAIVMREAS